MTYPIILPAIVIDASNNAIRMKENSTLGGTGLDTVEIVPDVYTLPDLLDAVVVALNSHANVTNANTYSVSFAADSNPANKSAIISFSKSGGSSTFQLLWADALTTFDPALIGFSANTLDDVNAKTNTLSPSGLWVSPAIVEEKERKDQQDAWVTRSPAGVVVGGTRGENMDVLRFGVRWVDARRAHHAYNTTDPDAAFSRVLAKLKTGRAFELHFVDLSAGQVANPVSSGTLYGTAWHVSDDAVDDDFDPERHSPAVALYAWALTFWGYVA